MMNLLIATSVLALGSAFTLMAQSNPAPNDQPMGRGRGGAPYAWNDKDKDGICDITGKPVGQGRGQCGMRARGRRGCCAGTMGRGFRGGQQQQNPSGPPK
jgi:hypothetical protein